MNDTLNLVTIHSLKECFECRTHRGKLIQAKLADDGTQERHIHCLIASVTSLQSVLSNEAYVILDEKLKTSSSSSVHLINWIDLEYNGW